MSIINYITLKEISNYKEKLNKYFISKIKYKIYLKKVSKNNKNYLSNMFKITDKTLSNINGYSLDKEQRNAVLIDEDSYLIVAGAGSGKTLTMIGKIRYLIEYKKIKPEEILCISFTNFTTDSLRKAVNKQTNYNVDILTFHKLSLSIIKKAGKKIQIASDNLLLDNIIKFFKEELLKDRNLLNSFVSNYCLFSNVKLNKDDENFYNDEELIISNILFFCGIKYEYKVLGIIDDKIIKAFYLEEYNIYLKHYTLSKKTNILAVNDFMSELESIRKIYNCKVFETYSHYFTDGTIFDEIKTFFTNNNIKINYKVFDEVYCIYYNESNNFKNLYNLITTFINLFKSWNYSYDKYQKIEEKVKKCKNKIEKNRLFTLLEIIKKIYIKYQMFLKQNNMLDFNDMINYATILIKENDVILNYKYIIIDEYQDTSYSRYNLIKCIKNQCLANLVAVGDDFQSIYRFTGCDINMFIKFNDNFKYSKILYLTNTYRNSKELIKVAGDFIMKNKFQIKKKLYSNKSINKPIKIYFYKHKNEISNLFNLIEENNIYALGRNNRDINYFNNDDFIIFNDNIKYKNRDNLSIKFMSVHKSKGLESDGVVIVNLEDNVMGFPSKCMDDILLSYLNKYEVYYPYDEERRLFYVALTRTKKNVYLFVPYYKKSIFVSEIVKDNKNLIEFFN